MLKHRHQIIFSILIIITLISLTAYESHGFKAFCNKVIDGHTLVLNMPEGRLKQVKLIGVKTPSLNQHYGKEAADFKRKIVEEKSVNAKFEKLG